MLNNRRPPNIVFIVLDTQRSDRLGCYGYSRGTTPNLDAFAQSATLFENAISPAQWTVPSHASMFTGEPPSTHLTLQSSDALPPVFTTLAEHLGALGYRRTGICNNPLVGVINNNLKRGFQDFYNYCGTVQSRAPAPLRTLWRRDVFGVARHALRQIVDPIQDAFGRYSQVFQAALNPFWVPLWTRFARFKGDTPRSIRDTTRFVRQHLECDGGASGKRPHFLFVNLMEPHLPYSPPDRFVQSFCPYLNTNRDAYEFMHNFNRQAVEWLTPASSPLSELHARTMSDMYDAEVAYQDQLLADLLDVLNQPERRDNTMVILVGDHGEMLGEKQYIGHAFGVYRELIHVPLIIRWPGQTEGQRMDSTVSATRLFHTVMEAAGVKHVERASGQTIDLGDHSLRVETSMTAGRRAAAGQPVVSEAHPPEFALQTMENHKPDLIDPMACNVTHWALYDDTYKLIHIQDTRDELYNLADDPWEKHALRIGSEDRRLQSMHSQLAAYLDSARARRPNGQTGEQVDLEDERVRERLRGLGYIE